MSSDTHARARAGSADADEIRALFGETLVATGSRARGRQADAIERLQRAALAGPPGIVVSLLAECLRSAVAALWTQGWQPGDVVPIFHRLVLRDTRPATRKRLNALLILAIVDEHRDRPRELAVPARWAAQIAGLEERIGKETGGSASLDDALIAPPGSEDERETIRTVAQLAWALSSVPPLTPLGPPPDQWPKAGAGPSRAQATNLDPGTLDKIRGLLAKAESTTFEAEALAFTAKAQELMARYAIDRAVLDQAEGHDDAGPQRIRIHLDDPYSGERFMLVTAVAEANRCRAVWTKQLGVATVFGFDVDLEIVEVLYTSLLVQATAAVAAHGPQTDPYGRSATRSFRQAFLVGFAERIGERLRSATDDVTAAADETTTTALVPLLAERERHVEDDLSAAFPDVRSKATRVSHAGGWVAGTVAAEQATLVPGAPLHAG